MVRTSCERPLAAGLLQLLTEQWRPTVLANYRCKRKPPRAQSSGSATSDATGMATGAGRTRPASRPGSVCGSGSGGVEAAGNTCYTSAQHSRGTQSGASRPQGTRRKRRRRPRNAWTERCCSPIAGSRPSSGCVASGAGGDSREVPALRASPSAGVAPIRARPSRPSPDRDWEAVQVGGIARSRDPLARVTSGRDAGSAACRLGHPARGAGTKRVHAYPRKAPPPVGTLAKSPVNTGDSKPSVPVISPGDASHPGGRRFESG